MGCVHDGLVYVNPQPELEEIEKFYQAKEYFLRQSEEIIGYANYLADKPAIIKNSERAIGEMMKYCPDGKLLDIGCAYGFSMAVARSKGFEVFGNDLNKEALAYAKDILHLPNLRAGYVGMLGYADASFDAVTMLGTIEHFQNPLEEISTANRVLKLGGTLAIVTVDSDSLIGRGSIRPPEHLYYFSAKTMRVLLEKNGFEVLAMKPHFWFNIFYFTVEYFIVRTCDYFYRLTTNSLIKKILNAVKKFLVYIARKIGLSNRVIPGIDGQFLTIARRKS